MTRPAPTRVSPHADRAATLWRPRARRRRHDASHAPRLATAAVVGVIVQAFAILEGSALAALTSTLGNGKASSSSTAGEGSSPMATQPPRDVTVIGRSGERLTEELIRELGSAHFRVDRLQARPRQPAEETLATIPRHVRRGVLVSTETGHVVIFARGGPRPRPAPQRAELARAASLDTRIDLLVNGADRFSRRRACLTVVEYLRVLAVADTLPASEGHSASSDSSADSSSTAPRLGSAGSTKDPSSALTGDGTAADSNELAPAEQGSPSDLPGPYGSPRASRTLAVGASLDLNAGIGQSTGHVQFIWRFPLSAGWTIGARALWPILGADFASGSQQMRLWSFGAAADLRYTFADPATAVRPFIALLGGTRLLLTDARLPGVPTSATSMTPSATLGLTAGLSYRLTPNADAYLESGASQAWRFPVLEGSDTAAAAAETTFFTTSIGVTFEY